MPLAARSLLLDVARRKDCIIAVGERGHVLISNDGGQSWNQAEVPTRGMLTAVAMIDSDRAFAVGHDRIILSTTDGGQSWSHLHAAPEVGWPLLDVWFADGEHGIAAGAYGVLMTTADAGRSWQMATIATREPHINAIVQTPAADLFAAAEFGLIFRSRDRGASWQLAAKPYEGSLFGALATAETILTFGLRGRLFRSTDHGGSWHRIETGTTATLLCGRQLGDGRIVIGGLGGTLLVSEDQGQSFGLNHDPARLAVSGIVELEPSSLLLVGEGGLRRLDHLGGNASITLLET